jgi:uncharacterized DUF497 family protein
MRFEFDASKSKANLAKDGINFEMAQELWRDVEGLLVPCRNSTEPRKLLVAQREGKLWTAIFTERGDATRIISVRRAQDNERAAYYEQSDDSGKFGEKVRARRGRDGLFLISLKRVVLCLRKSGSIWTFRTG